MGCRYVEEFDFGPRKVHVQGYSRGGPVKKAGAVTPVVAVHKHEKNMHPGKPLTNLAPAPRVSGLSPLKQAAPKGRK